MQFLKLRPQQNKNQA